MPVMPFDGCGTNMAELALAILDEALRELDEAAEYLEAERAGFGRLLLAEFDRKLEQILAFPGSGSWVEDMAPEYRVRSFPLLRFGYSILVGSIDGVPTIIAFVHHSREPGYWLARLEG
jgi:plasmid stabilization system protein ParE